jgi:PPOX class probable F420-dependent enzyme
LNNLASFTNAKYISVETYRKSGQAIKTPVWFVVYDDLIHVITREKTGKVKRLRNNPKLKFALCNFSGKLLGDWHSGNVEFVSGKEFEKVLELRRKKYGIMDVIARFASRNKGDLVVFSIKFDM